MKKMTFSRENGSFEMILSLSRSSSQQQTRGSWTFFKRVKRHQAVAPSLFALRPILHLHSRFAAIRQMYLLTYARNLMVFSI